MHAYATGSRTPVYVALAAPAVAIAVALDWFVDAVGFDGGWFISAPSIGGAYALLLAAFDTWAWRWRWLRKIGFTATPDVEGIYEGTIRSTYEGKQIPVRLVIEQRWLRVLIRFEVMGTATSSSRSVAAAILEEGHRDSRVIYTYKNQVRPGYAEPDMNDHDGTADIVITPLGTVSGRYFNARGRQGDLRLQRVREQH